MTRTAPASSGPAAVPQAAADTVSQAAADAVALLARRGWTVATAESLTGGQVCAALTSVPGASAVVVGGIVAYCAAVKRDLLGVEADLIRSRGTVDVDVAAAMAVAARARLGSHVGLATTGVAGPEPLEGKPVGTVFIAVSTAEGVHTRRLMVTGDRVAIRHATTHALLTLLPSVVAATGYGGALHVDSPRKEAP